MNDEVGAETTLEIVGEPASDFQIEKTQAEGVVSLPVIVGLLLAGAVIGFLLRSMKKDTGKEKSDQLQRQNQTLRNQHADAVKAKNEAEAKLDSFNKQADKVAQANSDASKQAKKRDAEKDSSIKHLLKPVIIQMSQSVS